MLTKAICKTTPTAATLPTALRSHDRLVKSFAPFRLRRAHTLVEMVALIGTTGVLMSLTAVCMQRSVQAQRVTMEAIIYQRQVDGLRAKLKMDLSQARSVAHDTSTKKLAIQFLRESTHQTVEYGFGVNKTTRFGFAPDGQSHSNEVWSVFVDLLDVRLDETGAVPLVHLQVRLTPNDTSASTEEFSWMFRMGQGVMEQGAEL